MTLLVGKATSLFLSLAFLAPVQILTQWGIKACLKAIYAHTEKCQYGECVKMEAIY
jgi:hypothetical protein